MYAFLIGIIPVSLLVKGNAFYYSPAFNYILGAYALIGVIAGILAREERRIYFSRRRFFSILLGDDFFQEYATLSYVSFLYAVAKGALLGVSLGFMQLFVSTPIFYSYYVISSGAPVMSAVRNTEFLLYALLAVCALVPLRILLEDYLLLFNAVKGITRASSKYVSGNQDDD